jgi:nucleoside-diphosphate-sugar epimerase
VPSFKNRRCLVTGGAGFIGSWIVKRLLAENAEQVVVLDDFTYKRDDLISEAGDQVVVRKGDITDKKLVKETCEGIDVIFHQAAQADVPASLRIPERDFQVNANGTLNVLTAALATNVERVIYAGSASAYGDNVVSPTDRRFVETLAPSPLSPYAASKLAGEMLCTAYYHSFGLRTTSLRYFSIYGPGELPKTDSYSLVVAIFVPQAIRGEELVIFGDGKQVRDFTHVDDIATANLLAAKTNAAIGETINVGTGQQTSIMELALSVKKLVRDVPYGFGPRPKGDPLGGCADTTKCKRVLEFTPEKPLEDGIREYAEWYRSHVAKKQLTEN